MQSYCGVGSELETVCEDALLLNGGLSGQQQRLGHGQKVFYNKMAVADHGGEGRLLKSWRAHRRCAKCACPVTPRQVRRLAPPKGDDPAAGPHHNQHEKNEWPSYCLLRMRASRKGWFCVVVNRRTYLLEVIKGPEVVQSCKKVHSHRKRGKGIWRSRGGRHKGASRAERRVCSGSWAYMSRAVLEERSRWLQNGSNERAAVSTSPPQSPALAAACSSPQPWRQRSHAHSHSEQG